MQDAIKKLKVEINGMMVRIGMLQHQLASKQRKQLISDHMALDENDEIDQ